MFDLSKMNFITNTRYSFVGIKRNVDSEKPLDFFLPHGFELLKERAELGDEESYDMIKKFFFKMYKTFKKNDKEEKSQENLNNDRDGFNEKEGGFSTLLQEEEEVVLYAKLNVLDRILDGYDEMRIAKLENKQSRSINIDYSQMHKYLHKAVFIENDVAYIEEMNLARPQLIKNDHPIIQLFCYIYVEIKKELDELNDIERNAIDSHEDFKNEYLNDSDGLFIQDEFKNTITILKDQLDRIENYTTYKDEDYWHFHEAVEAFLYEDNNYDDTTEIYWGISNFSYIWEKMCNAYVLSNKDKFNEYLSDKILYIDIDGVLRNCKELTIKHPFSLRMTNSKTKRDLRPDLIYIHKVNLIENFIDLIFKITDYEYVNGRKKVKAKKVTLQNTSFRDLEELAIEATKLYRYSNNNYMSERAIRGFPKKIENLIVKEMNSDVIIKKKPLILDFDLEVIDYKYMPLGEYETFSINDIDRDGKNKIKTDIKKQLLYEFALQQNLNNSRTKSHFWIPSYFLTDEFMDIQVVENAEIEKSKIEIYKINFSLVQDAYLSFDFSELKF